MENGPNILLLDLETLPNVVTTWGLKVDGYLDHKNLIQERTILCAAWKWVGVDKIRTISVNPAKTGTRAEDYRILKRLWKEFMLADAVVAHNGDYFDIPWVRTRCIFLGLPPLKPIIQIDTRKLARDKFNFNSNRLDYLAQFLGLGNKIKTDYDLWLKCMPSQPRAVRETNLAKMVKYNKHDIRLLEGVFLKLRPHVPSKINHALFADPDSADRTCPTCGQQDSLRLGGQRYTRVGITRAYVCGQWASKKYRTGGIVPGTGCGAWCYRPVNSKIPR